MKNRKIKVLHILNTGGYSGAENVAICMIKGMDKFVNATYVSPSGIIDDVLEKEKIRHIAVDKINIANMKKIIKKENPDLIHAHDFTTGIIVSLSTFTIPIINHIHNNSPWIKRCGIKSLVYLASSTRYKRILTVSDSIENEYIFGNLIKHKSEVVGNPIDLNSILIKANQKKGGQYYDVAFVGRLSKEKNPLLFVKIIEELTKEIKDLKVVMVGDGTEKEMVKKYINERGLVNTIDMLGFQENPYVYMLKSKVICMPSIWEGFGLVAVEGLALGKPIVCSGAGGLKDIVDNNCGMICDSLEKYVLSIEELLKDDILYKNKVVAAKKRAKELDNLDSYCLDVLKIYNSIFVI